MLRLISQSKVSIRGARLYSRFDKDTKTKGFAKIDKYVQRKLRAPIRKEHRKPVYDLEWNKTDPDVSIPTKLTQSVQSVQVDREAALLDAYRSKTLQHIDAEVLKFAGELKAKGHTCIRITKKFPTEISWCECDKCIKSK